MNGVNKGTPANVQATEYTSMFCGCGWPLPSEGMLISGNPDIDATIRIIVRCPGCDTLYTMGKRGGPREIVRTE